MTLVRFLFAVRSLPARLVGERGLPAESTVALYEQMTRRFVPLAEEPGREVAVGGIGQMWRLAGGVTPTLQNASEFLAFGEPGYAKVATNFSALPSGDATELRTETRVLTTDPASRRAFGRYWRIIRPGSGLIRRSWLRAARRKAERDGMPSAGHGAEGGAGRHADDGCRAARPLLAAVFAGAGGAKIAFPKDRLGGPMPWVEDFSQGTVSLIGALELLGAVGVVAPRTTGVLPALGPLAAVGLATVMVGGFATHVVRGEYLSSGSNVVLFALAVSVARGEIANS